MVEEQRNVLETHWSPDRLVINKSHGSDWTVVFGIRPYTSNIKNINNFTLRGTLQRLRQIQMLPSISQCALEGIGSFSTNTWMKTWLVKKNRPKFPPNTAQARE